MRVIRKPQASRCYPCAVQKTVRTIVFVDREPFDVPVSQRTGFPVLAVSYTEIEPCDYRPRTMMRLMCRRMYSRERQDGE